jgi:acetoin utilization protein AcuC
MMTPPILIGSEIYRGSSYGPRHPLSVQRVPVALDLIGAMEWLDERRYVDSPLATPEQLARFHHPDYIAALQRAERDGSCDEAVRRRHNFGCNGNPIFPEMFRRPATACGGTLEAARLLIEGAAETVYHPAGGTHHGRPDQASGFCYFNDPVLGILRFLDAGLAPVYYVDIDAHHGDGVQDAFADDARVFTLSVHEDGRWPYTGGAGDRAGGAARTLPVPAGSGDAELAYVMERAVLPIGAALEPAVVVLQCGADGLADDPMSNLMLSNRGLWAAVHALMNLAPRLLVLGGGGYNPWAVGRCWAGVWATLNGIDPTVAPTPGALAVLARQTWNRSQGRVPLTRWLTTIADPPQHGDVRAEVREVVAAVLAP